MVDSYLFHLHVRYTNKEAKCEIKKRKAKVCSILDSELFLLISYARKLFCE